MVIIQVLAASLLLYTVLYYTESLFELLLTDHEHFHEVCINLFAIILYQCCVHSY